MRSYIAKALESFDKLPKEEIKRILTEVVAGNEIFEAVLTSVPHGLVVAGKDDRVIFATKMAGRLIPMHKGDPTDLLLVDVIKDPEISKMVADAISNNETITTRDFVFDKGGRTEIINCGFWPLFYANKIQGNLLQIKNVTEKRTEAAQLKRMESLASLTTLTAGVAHEIKNPLGSLGIYIQLIARVLENCPKNLKEKTDLLEYLSIMDEEVNRLNSIVMNYLFTVRPVEILPIKADINKLIEELTEFLGPELDKDNIELKIQLLQSPPPLDLDVEQMKQALLNIIKNAQGAMPHGGTLSISTKIREDRFFIYIGDTGEGIPKELRAKIFEPYFTTRETGTGLGLTLVYKIIKEHGGDVHVSSETNRGTIFYISLKIPQKEKHLLSSPEE